MTTERPEITLNLPRALTPAEDTMARAVAVSVWPTAYRMGWEDAVAALTRVAFEAATDALAEAVREVAAGGPVAAAMLLPRTRTVVRNDKGQITAVTERIA